MFLLKERLAVLSVLFPLLAGCGNPEQAERPVAFSTERFAALVDTLSEPGGFFESDNYVSNEAGYLHVSETLEGLGAADGVYIGVGPDQNFTYIARIRPRYAFILDIRRENLVQHMLFKAIFVLAESRAEYLSILFSKPLPEAGFGEGKATIGALLAYFDRTEGDDARYRRNLNRIQTQIQNFGVPLNDDEISWLAGLYRTFFERHLDLSWEYRSDGNRGIAFITYREFLLGRDLTGAYGNFLNSDEDYRYVRDMQARNAIIPVTGDFAGGHALRAIGDYVRARGDRVSVFYLSNVEFYLHPAGLLDEFAENLRYLPTDRRSVVIRAFVNLRNRQHPMQVDGHLMTTVLQYTRSFGQLFADGAYRSYLDIGMRNYMQ